jgi:hypothetical protein
MDLGVYGKRSTEVVVACCRDFVLYRGLGIIVLMMTMRISGFLSGML